MRESSSPSTLMQWPGYDTTSQQYIRLRANRSLIESHFVADRVHFWNSLAPVLMDECDATDCSQCGEDNTVGAGSMSQAVSGLICVLAVIHFIL